jgi:hypothetical protein
VTEPARANRRSGNPSVRAAAVGDDVVTPLEKEAAEDTGPITFEYAGDTWQLIDDFKPLRFQRIAESGRIAEALDYALGEDQYLDLEDVITSVAEVEKVAQVINEALVPGQGNSRASRRSSNRNRPARR